MRELVVSNTEYYINKSLNFIENNTRISGTYVIFQEFLTNDEVDIGSNRSPVVNLHPISPSDSSTSPHESNKITTYPRVKFTAAKTEVPVLSRRNEILRRSKWVAGAPKREVTVPVGLVENTAKPDDGSVVPPAALRNLL